MYDDKAPPRSAGIGVSVNTTQTHPPDGITFLSPDKIDHRSDEEITAWLQKRHPVTSDKNIWTFWHSGFAQMRPWVQRNVINWVKRLGPDWTVHVVDRVDGSETCIFNYIDTSLFPQTFIDGTMDGHKAHQGDLVRLPLLWKYGGLWMDAGLILLRHVDDICWKRIEDPESPYELSAVALMHLPDTYTPLNGFLATKRHNSFIKRWHEIYVALWDGVTNAAGFHKHPLLCHLPVFRPPKDAANMTPVEVNHEAFTDYVAHYMCCERLRKLSDPSDGFNGAEWYKKHMLLLNAREEMFYAQEISHWDAQHQFDLLSLPRSGDDAVVDKKWQEAEDFVTSVLANTSMVKLPHGPGSGGLALKMLADIWDDEENHNKDNEEGTFAAYLRYGSTHFDQTREVKKLDWQNPEEEVYTVGYLEPINVS